MPRSMAPPPSGEFNIRVQKPFSGPAQHTVEITGEPNRQAVIKTTENSGANIIEKTGDFPKDDVTELLSLVSQIRGFPSHATKDIYGLDTKLESHTLELQWTNEEEDPAAESVNELPAETKQTFKDVVDSIFAAGRQFAKQDSRV
ncbi:hypothetical protein AAFC00_005151 [Neodothiora populina]|uniref:Uncharacterized protein n=1 Tax=Neodothiora populina TaxID=2781224 RepID=A0ABR3PJZ0_9PEZI